MFLTIETKINITLVMLIISHFLKNLSHQHNETVKTIFKYLKRSKNC